MERGSVSHVRGCARLWAREDTELCVGDVGPPPSLGDQASRECCVSGSRVRG